VTSSITGTSGSVFVSAAARPPIFTVSAPASATGGTAFNFTVTAQDQFNNTATSYGGTVHFTSSDGAAVLPANSTLTNGTGTFAATLNTGGNQTITATDNGDLLDHRHVELDQRVCRCSHPFHSLGAGRRRRPEPRSVLRSRP